MSDDSTVVPADLSQEELVVFLREADELLRFLEQQIVVPGSPANESVVLSMMRAAHTLKGSSSMIGYRSMSEAAHELENSLEKLGNGELTLTTELIDALYRGTAALRTLTGNLARLAPAVAGPGFRPISSGTASGHASAGLSTVPLATLFGSFHRMVHDLADELGKTVDLRISAERVEVATASTRSVRTPLIHIIRNAVCHGIERPDERVAAGKSHRAVIELSARRTHTDLVITVKDDGRGIDLVSLKQRAIRRGLLSARAAKYLSDSEVIDLIWTPGLSTSRVPAVHSGRGFGMDIVRRTVKEIGGNVEISSARGQHTRVVLRMPLAFMRLHVASALPDRQVG